MAAADFNLSKFKGALAGGGARPSLFDFSLSGLPTGVTGLGNINYFCQVSALPPLTVTPIEKQYFGRTVKIPGDMVFGDLDEEIEKRIKDSNPNIYSTVSEGSVKARGHL